MGRSSWIIWGCLTQFQDPCKGEAGESGTQGEGREVRAEVREARRCSSGPEEGGGSQEPRNAGSVRGQERGGRMSQQPPEGTQPVELLSICEHQNCEMLGVCCFQALTPAATYSGNSRK